MTRRGGVDVVGAARCSSHELPVVPRVCTHQVGMVVEREVPPLRRRDESVTHKENAKEPDVLFVAALAATTQRVGIGR